MQEQTLIPESVLASFRSPGDRNDVFMVVSRTGRTVAARRGAPDGTVLARAYEPFAAEPRIELADLQKANPQGWKQDFRSRFTVALKEALAIADAPVDQGPMERVR